MTSQPKRIGLCKIKTQGKLLTQLEGKNLPQIGSRVCVARKGQYELVGEVVEAIGSTKSPWIVISAKKDRFKIVKIDEALYAAPRPEKRRSRRRKIGRKRKK